VKFLWTFEDQVKLDKFTSVLDEHEIPYEINSKGIDSKTNQLTISVDDGEYENSRKLLMKHKKRKSSR